MIKISLIKSHEELWNTYLNPDTETADQLKWQAAFFAELRRLHGTLSQNSIDHLKTYIFVHRTFFADSPLPFFAWFLGNIYNEVGANMAPIKETQRPGETLPSDAKVVARLDAWWKSGKAAKKGVRQPYWRKNDYGMYAFGRGPFQHTHHENYVKARVNVAKVTGIDIAFDENYELVMDPLAGAIAGFAGALYGQYTGRHLRQYLSNDGSFDYRNARKIVNGDVFNYDRVAGFCRTFEAALNVAEKAVPGFLFRVPSEPKLPVVVDVQPDPRMPPVLLPIVTELDIERIKQEAPALIALGIQVHVNFHVMAPPNFPPARTE